MLFIRFYRPILLLRSLKSLTFVSRLPRLKLNSRKLSLTRLNFDKNQRYFRNVHDFDKFVGVFNFLLKRKIEKREIAANENPKDPHLQARFLECLLAIDPLYVVKRVESGQFAVNSRVREIYQQATLFQPHDTKFSHDRPNISFNTQQTSGSSEKTPRPRLLLSVIKTILTWCIIYILFVMFMNRKNVDISSMIVGSNEVDEIKPETVDIRFDDIRGNKESKQELMEIVDFLRNPNKYKEFGCRGSSGVLITGPPGCGKTMLAKAIAGEANVPFFYVSGSSFDEVFVGVGASRIRKLFAKAREKAPSIIFIDELDAVGSKRSSFAAAPYSRITINQLLTEMDGFKASNVVVIGATNDPNVLDQALVRAGRFDTRLEIPLPCCTDRIDILDYYLNKIKRGKDINVKRVAAMTPGASGADLSNLVNQAAIRAVTRESRLVMMDDIDWARDKILMGRERKSVVLSDLEKRRVSAHEAGHAVVAFFTEGSNKLHKATIMPRGHSLGLTQLVPDGDEHLVTYQQLLASIDVFMGGRAAEELFFGRNQVTTGCISDLSGATTLAKQLVTKCGYSQKFGLNFVEDQTNGFSFSQLETKIHEEIKLILEASYTRALKLLQSHSQAHTHLSEALMKHETLDEKQIREILSS